jgi:hypothetical protein
MTIADTIYDTINDNWGSGGYAGDTPAIDTTETQRARDYTTADVVEVRHYTLREQGQQLNDKYVNRRYSLDVYISSKTSSAQLKLLYDEVEYLLRNTAMTGVQLESIDKDWTFTEYEQGRHAIVLRVRVVTFASDGAVTSAAGTTASMQALLMYGSANAAYVPCVFEVEGTAVIGKVGYSSGTAMLANVDGSDMVLRYVLALPTNKGSLKLYTTGFRISIYDADADDYVTSVKMYGMDHDTVTSLLEDATDRTAQGVYTSTVAAADCSSYKQIVVLVGCFNTNAADLDIACVEVNCYYA